MKITTETKELIILKTDNNQIFRERDVFLLAEDAVLLLKSLELVRKTKATIRWDNNSKHYGISLSLFSPSYLIIIDNIPRDNNTIIEFIQ